MQKIKKWFSDNHVYLTLGLSLFIGGLLAYVGFEKGVQKENKKNKKAEIDQIETKVENVILEEKLKDSQKDIHEISSDVDNLLDRK